MADEEVSEQPQEAPAEEELQAEEEVVEKPLPQQPKKVIELDAICGELRMLADVAEQTLGSIETGTDSQLIQAQLRVYASELSHFPRLLQYLNDYRRLFKSIEQQALKVEAALTKARGDAEALSSEETRIIVSCGSVKDAILSSIWAIEEVLGNVRHSTQRLLEIIGYDAGDFVQFLSDSKPILRVDLVSHVVHRELQKLNALKADILALDELESHARELENV